MSILPESRIKELVREKMNGKSYSEIREELATSGLSPDEIRTSIRQVDERVLGETVKQGERDPTKQWSRVGLILAVIGLVLSIAYNAGFVLNTFPALLIYSPFLVGILLMLYGRTVKKKQKITKEKGTGAIRKKRPYI